VPFRRLRSRLIEILNELIEILGGEKCWRGFSVRQDPLYGRTAPRSAVGTSSGFDSPAALLGRRRVSARQGWAGEKSGLFEHPANHSFTFTLRTTQQRVAHKTSHSENCQEPAQCCDPRTSPFLKGKFRALTGRKVGPALLLVFIEAAEERHEAIEGAKF
jgi:hypothetical protein